MAEGIKIDIEARDRASADVKRVARELDDLARSSEKVADATGKVNGRYRDAQGRLREANGQFAKGAGGADKLAKSMLGVGAAYKVATLGAEAYMAITRAATQAVIASTKAAGDLEQQLTRVAAVTDGSTKNFNLFKAAAVDASLKSAFSANEAGGALEFMAMAGFEATESTGSLANVLQLAAASGSDLAVSADIVTNVMTGYGKTVGELSHVNDVLVGTFTNTNTTLEQIGQAFKFVGPVARASGQDFELMAAAIGLMGNAGIQSTMAGRTLRMSLIRLQNPPKAAAAALKELGVEVLDTNGNLRRFDQILLDLQKSGARTKELGSIFGTEAVAGIQALLSQDPAKLTEFSEKLTSGVDGLARSIEQIQLDTFNSKLSILTGQIDTLAASVGDRFLRAGSGMLEVLSDVTVQAIENTDALDQLDAVAIDIVKVTGQLARVSADLVGPMALVVGLTLELGKGSVLAAKGMEELFDVLTNYIPILGQIYDLYQLFDDAQDEATVTGKLFRGEIEEAFELMRDGKSTLSEITEYTENFGSSLDAMSNLGKEAKSSLHAVADGADRLAGNLDYATKGYNLFSDYAFKAIKASGDFKDSLVAQMESGEGYLGWLGKVNDGLEEYGKNLLRAFELGNLVGDMSFSEAEVGSFNSEADALEEAARRKREEERRKAAAAAKKRQEELYKREVTLAKIAVIEGSQEPIKQAHLKYQLAMVEASKESFTVEERRLAQLEAERTLEADIARVKQDAWAEEEKRWQERARENEAARKSADEYARYQENFRKEQDAQTERFKREIDERMAKEAEDRSTVYGAAGAATSSTSVFSQAIRAGEQQAVGDRQAQIEQLQGVDTSKWGEQQKAAHQARIESIEAEITAIEAQNAALEAQISLMGEVGGQGAILAESLATLAANQWNFKDAAEATNSALSAGVAIAGALTQAAGLGVKERAKWMAAFEAAAAIAAGAAALSMPAMAPTFTAAAIQHGVAAAQFGLVAGGVIGSAGSSGSGGGGGGGMAAPAGSGMNLAEERRKAMDDFAAALKGEEGGGGVVINIDFGSSFHADGYDTLARKLGQVVGYDARNTFSLMGQG